jgi:hypothetical protein
MWIYQRVAGDVHEYFPDVLATSELVETIADPELDRAFADLKRRMAEVPMTLVPWARASAEERARNAAAYHATLELAVLLDRAGGIESRDRRIADVTFAILDFLEEWRPYISREDAALNHVKLDGADLPEALAAIDESASISNEHAPYDADCPLCAMLARAGH